MLNTTHTPVLLNETIAALKIEAGKWYVDGTFGFGGHSREIIRSEGKVLGIDQDQAAINQGKKEFKKEISKGLLILEQSNFRTLNKAVTKYALKPCGVLLDLGFSSWQLDQSGRGFSFWKNEVLDMRMDPENQAVRACDLLNGLYEKELEKLISSYGEDPLAGVIARYIVKARKLKPLEMTFDLAKLIREAYKHYYCKHSSTDPATKTFQALRIAVNDEINALKEGLFAAFSVISKGGRVVVISFHGLEHRITKKYFNQWVNEGKGALGNKKPIIAQETELKTNRRSHSAKLRTFIKN